MVLLLLAPLAAVILSGADRRYGALAETVVNALATGSILGTFLLTYRLWRDREAQPAGLDLVGLADKLAVVVRRQWETEANSRQLNDPRPLPVRWIAADPELSFDWEALKTSAVDSAGVGDLEGPDEWARSPEELAGEGNQLPAALSKVPTKRLLILGEPGAGKTMLMIRLVLDLIARRQPGDKVPVLISLASWSPAQEDLHEWLVSQLAIDIGLVGRPTRGLTQESVIAQLLEAHYLIPILDGLDEIPDHLRPGAIARINEAMRPRQPMVVTCRTRAYLEAIRPDRRHIGAILRAAAIELSPLDALAVARYLIDDASGPDARARWAPVIDQLNPITPVGQALTTPLMVGLARATYNVHANFSVVSIPDPAELCDPALVDREAVERHLFDAFVSSAYRPSNMQGRRATTAEAERWLIFLASHLEATIQSYDLAWWELQTAVTPAIKAMTIALLVGVCTAVAAGLGTGIAHGLRTGVTAGLGAGVAGAVGIGLAIGLMARTWPSSRHPTVPVSRQASLAPAIAAGTGAAIAVGLSAGMSSGIQHGLLAGLDAGRDPALAAGIALGIVAYLSGRGQDLPKPARGLRLRFSLAGIAGALAAGIGAGLAVGLPYGLPEGPVYGILAAIAGLLAVGFAAGLKGVPPDPGSAAVSPWIGLNRDRSTSLGIILLAGMACGLVFAVGYSVPVGIGVGLTSGLAFGLVVSAPQFAWPFYFISRAWLAKRRRLPWKLKGFLIDAHRRGVLRQAGTIYQFRHAGLQHRLATRPRAWHIELIVPVELADSIEETLHALAPDATCSRTGDQPTALFSIEFGRRWEQVISLAPGVKTFLVVSFPVKARRHLTDCENFLQIVQALDVARQQAARAVTSFTVEAPRRRSAMSCGLARHVETAMGLKPLTDGGDLPILFRPSQYLRRGQDLVVELASQNTAHFANVKFPAESNEPTDATSA